MSIKYDPEELSKEFKLTEKLFNNLLCRIALAGLPRTVKLGTLSLIQGLLIALTSTVAFHRSGLFSTRMDQDISQE
jgi:hypothetical protein